MIILRAFAVELASRNRATPSIPDSVVWVQIAHALFTFFHHHTQSVPSLPPSRSIIPLLAMSAHVLSLAAVLSVFAQSAYAQTPLTDRVYPYAQVVRRPTREVLMKEICVLIPTDRSLYPIALPSRH